jgi:hypothetical protein
MQHPLTRVATLATLSLATSALAQTTPNQGITPSPQQPASDRVVPAVAEPMSDQPAQSSSTAAIPPASTHRLVVSVAPYAWLTSFNGDTTVRDINIDVDLDFTDVLDDAESIIAFMGAVDVKYDRLVFQFNGAYSQAEFEPTPGVLPSGATVQSRLDNELGWYEFLGGYRFIDNPVTGDAGSRRRWTLDGYAGARYTDLRLDASLSNSTAITLPDGEVLNPGTTAERAASEDWWEPFVGARVGVDISENWTLSLRADLGGFGIGDADLAWQAVALAGYHWRFETWTLTGFAGYRALSQDYSTDTFAWDVTTHGPLLGVQATIPF